MDSKLRAAIALYLHAGTPDAEKEAARRGIERLSKSQGMTFDEAIAAYHADPEAEARAKTNSSWEDLYNNHPDIKEMLREFQQQEQLRKDREARMWADKDKELQAAKAATDMFRDKAWSLCGRT